MNQIRRVESNIPALEFIRFLTVRRDMKKRSRLPVINSLEIPNPCEKSWEQMEGDSKHRFCDHCSHSVTNLSEYTQKQASRLIANSSNGRICVRFRKDRDGRIQFKPEISVVSRIRQPAAAFAAAMLAALGLVPNAQAENGSGDQTKPACDQAAQENPDHTVVMGSPPVPTGVDNPRPQPSPTGDNSSSNSTAPANNNSTEVLGRVKAKTSR